MRARARPIGAWQARYGDGDGWLLVDGQLADGSAHHALGLIKQHNRFDFTTTEMLDLLSLPVGQRTTAFRRTANKYHPPTTWYLRLHAGNGVNPLYGLARIEAPASVATTDTIDFLAGAVFTPSVRRVRRTTRAGLRCSIRFISPSGSSKPNSTAPRIRYRALYAATSGRLPDGSCPLDLRHFGTSY